jgi:hydrogenase maturation protease
MQRSKTTVIIFGYGNPDRQDDGVAWHVLAGLAQRLGQSVPRDLEDEFDESGPPRLVYNLQLVPELAESIAECQRVCFVDAHTGSIPQDLQAVPLQPQFQNSPFSHHMTPQTLLALCQELYQAVPEALLVSIRGFEFGFSRSLSAQTQALSKQAIELILQWLNH